MITIGIILTLLVTLPMLGICLFLLLIATYELKNERPDAKPPTKDEWRQLDD